MQDFVCYVHFPYLFLIKSILFIICRGYIGVSSVVTAMTGLSLLLLLGVLSWDDCLSEKSAWDTLIWFAVLVGMASQLTSLGVVAWMSNCVEKFLHSFSLSSVAAFCVLQASYVLIHYLFASQTAHVAALYSAFLAMHLAAHVPGELAALALAYNTNLNGSLTHYSSGQAAVYFGGNFLPFFEYQIRHYDIPLKLLLIIMTSIITEESIFFLKKKILYYL